MVSVTRGAVRLSTSTPVVLHPVTKAEDLEAMPVETLTSLHDVLVPGRKTPRQKRRLARAILPELARASRGGQRAMSGVGVRARQLLAEGATTDQVIDRISAEFPGVVHHGEGRLDLPVAASPVIPRHGRRPRLPRRRRPA